MLLHMCIRGISGLRGIPELTKALMNLDDDIDEKEIEEAEKAANFAQKELEKGFPLLHAHFIVSLMGSYRNINA